MYGNFMTVLRMLFIGFREMKLKVHI